MEFPDWVCGFLGRRKKGKDENKSAELGGSKNVFTVLHVTLDRQDKSFSLEFLSNSFTIPKPFPLPRTTRFKDEAIYRDSVEDIVVDTDVPCDDKKEDDHVHDQPIGQDLSLYRNHDRDSEIVKSRDLTDSGIRMSMTELWPSTRLTRSCSDSGLMDNKVKMVSQDAKISPKGIYQEGINGISGRLKKCSSTNSRKIESFFTENTRALKGFQEISGFSLQNQNATVPMHSPKTTRVNEWIKGSLQQQPFQEVKEEHVDLRSPSPARILSNHSNENPKLDINEDISHANSFVRGLNSSSTVAHIVAVGLKVVPQISKFTSLRFANLSSNSIVHIAPGSLPRSLHTLNLSRNNINAITGLRELTRLRVLDLSHNRISQINQGLSNSRFIKELYLAENKISEVDGLHRLVKLSVLDLSFNKIATTKALGQLVANYNSLLALNLLGNPIHTNNNDDLLRKNLCSLLPQLVFLNKQPINNQKVREAGTRAVSKLALEQSHRTIHRKAVRKVSKNASVHKS